MVDNYGSQCGYCTPGFVVSMFEAYYRSDLAGAPDMRAKIGDQLNGNLCRCTGYRPIRDAMVDALQKPRPKDDLFQLRLRQNDGAVGPLRYDPGKSPTEDNGNGRSPAVFRAGAPSRGSMYALFEPPPVDAVAVEERAASLAKRSITGFGARAQVIRQPG